MDSLRQSIGLRIKSFREARKLTQGELAEKVGTDTPSISRYERGLVTPSIEQIFRISSSLAITPTELLPTSNEAKREELLLLRQTLLTKIFAIESSSFLSEVIERIDNFTSSLQEKTK